MSGMNLFELIRLEFIEILGSCYSTDLGSFWPLLLQIPCHTFLFLLRLPLCVSWYAWWYPTSLRGALFICRHLFFLLLSYCIITADLSSSLLILHSSHMLLNLYSKLSLLLIVLLNFKFSIWIFIYILYFQRYFYFQTSFSALEHDFFEHIFTSQFEIFVKKS